MLLTLTENGFTAFFQSLPAASVYLLCMWVKTRQPFLITKRSLPISLMGNFLARQSLWHPCILWLFPGAELLTGFALQSYREALRAHPHPWDHVLDQFANSSAPVWVSLMGLELRGFISNPRCLEMPLFYLQLQSSQELQLTLESQARSAFMFHLLHPGICHSDSGCSC